MIVDTKHFFTSIQAHPAELAKAVLAEVPKQVCEFFDLMGAGQAT